MGRYRKYFKIYRKMQEMNIKSLMYYRADFLMMTFFTLLSQVSNYLYKYSHSWRLVCMGNFIVIRVSVIFRRMGELLLSGFLENCTDGK